MVHVHVLYKYLLVLLYIMADISHLITYGNFGLNLSRSIANPSSFPCSLCLHMAAKLWGEKKLRSFEDKRDMYDADTYIYIYISYPQIFEQNVWTFPRSAIITYYIPYYHSSSYTKYVCTCTCTRTYIHTYLEPFGVLSLVRACTRKLHLQAHTCICIFVSACTIHTRARARAPSAWNKSLA